MVEVEVEKINIPGRLDVRQDVSEDDFSGDGQRRALGVVVNVSRVRPEELLVFLRQELLKQLGGERIARLRAGGSVALGEGRAFA